jgi:hypothetical protein
MNIPESEERSSIIFVLVRANKDAFSFLFGKQDQTCFQSEEAGVLYSLNKIKGLVDKYTRNVNKVSAHCIKDAASLSSIANKKEVIITYELYSYFLLWLVEQGLVSYPSELLEAVLKLIPEENDQGLSHDKREKIFKDREKIMRENLYTLLYKNYRVDKLNYGKSKKKSFIINDMKKGKGKYLGPKTKIETEKMCLLIRQVFFLHVRGGWFSTVNNQKHKGLGLRSRSVLFSKVVDAPMFKNGTDDPYVCIMDYMGEGERVYFDPSSPLEIVFKIDRITSLPTADKPGQYFIGIEDKDTPLWVPPKEGENNKLASNFTKEFLENDKRFQQLVKGFTAGKTRVDYNMSSNTKIISFLEYIYFISVLDMCNNIAGLPIDIFEHLYDVYITTCKKYDPKVILSLLEEHGWKRTFIVNKDIKRMGEVAINYSPNGYMWVHMNKDDPTKEDIAMRIAPIKKYVKARFDLITKKNIIFYDEVKTSFLKANQTPLEFDGSISKYCKRFDISIEDILPPLQRTKPKKTIKPPQSNPSKKNSDDEIESEGEEDENDRTFVVDDNEEDRIGMGSDQEEEEEEEEEQEEREVTSNKKIAEHEKQLGEIRGLFLENVRKVVEKPNDHEEVVAVVHVIQKPEDEIAWIAAQSLKQRTFFSVEDIFSDNPTNLISYTKHNFAPQLYLPAISTILLKAKIDEMKARIFIMMMIEKGDCEIRHLNSHDSDDLQESYSTNKAKEISEDFMHFVTLFGEAFLHNDDQIMSEDERSILGRCYCAHWIFVKQLYKTKEEALYLQMYESSEWIPVFFNTNLAIFSSHGVKFQGKTTNIREAFKISLRTERNLISIIPNVTDILGNNFIDSAPTGKRSSTRNQTRNMEFSDFLEAFHNKYGIDSSMQLHSRHDDMNNTFYIGSFSLVKYDSTCFSDLLYLSALYHLRRGFQIFDCNASEDIMLRRFLIDVCMLKLGIMNFIEIMVRMGRNNNKKNIPRGYCWLMLIYLKYNSIQDINDKTFSDITASMSNFIEKTMNHSHGLIDKKIDILHEAVEEKQDIESVFNMKYEMEKEFVDRKLKDFNLKGPETPKIELVFNC